MIQRKEQKVFGNNGREIVISLPKQTKYKRHQMSLSLHVLKI